MEVVFLGTGNAFASGGRHHMAVFLRSEGLGVLLDCGPSTLVALRQQSLTPDAIDVVLISHLHGDHFGGLPMLACDRRHGEPESARREVPFRVFGPRGTARAVPALVALFYPTLDASALGVEEIEAGETTSVGASLRFTPFPADHFSSGPAFGYRVELEGRTIVFSGDTAWTEALVQQSAGADLLICECSSFDAPAGKHVSHSDLLRNRNRLEAKRTLLVHAGSDVLARESELVFELAHDGTRVQL